MVLKLRLLANKLQSEHLNITRGRLPERQTPTKGGRQRN